ncbi:phage minor head protein [Conchiformibius steedae DSM 2580]|uniref:Phage minor head protein n=1 Tax=Conchiformibius steedae DSM 2580 TaxID=1121352 RepID=A0AAE9HTW9_9NEIS|nr:phage minor head protein [Conchiformibius steedae]QMT33459.1 hypothetical protein H3L98_10350 [Conchiformibius steedae]URD68114.1 phage minor head protein [Conchiformibius steedae DSM 2580]
MSVQFTSLLDRAAYEHLAGRELLPSYSHYDVWLYEHSVSFAVAKMMDMDLLAETKAALQTAMQNGTAYRDFEKRLKPFLMARGWWGEQVMTDPADGVVKTVQLGSTRRLRVIFQTNMATAYAAGRWQRIQAYQDDFPFLKYIPSVAEQKRQSHMSYYNRIWRVSDPIWQTIYPPNGYGCQCTVRQLTEAQALRERGEDIAKNPDAFDAQQIENHRKGVIDDGQEHIEWVEFTNPRTGQTVQVPFDITPTFAHNHAKRLDNLLDLAAEKHGTEFATTAENELAQYLAKRAEQELLSSSDNIIAEGKRLFEKHRETIITAFEQKQPHLGIMEAMRLEGVETGENVLLNGTDPDLVKEFGEVVSRYPQAWLDMSNAKGVTVVEAGDVRSFQTYLTLKDYNYLISNIDNPPAMYDHFVYALKNKMTRAGGSLISIALETNPVLNHSRYIHEFAHRLQAAMPDLNDLFVRLWHERTTGETAHPLQELTGILSYGKHEIAKKDGFPDPYYGKMYGDESNPLPREMMTMTFESLLGGNPALFAQLASKPDFFHFGLALLLRYKP